VQTIGSVQLSGSVLPLLPGDYNGDLMVDAADYSLWRDGLAMFVDSFDRADGNGDGVVDRADYVVWKRQFGSSMATPETSVATGSAGFESAASSSSIQWKEKLPSSMAPIVWVHSSERMEATIPPRVADAVFSNFEEPYRPTLEVLLLRPTWRTHRQSTTTSSANDFQPILEEQFQNVPDIDAQSFNGQVQLPRVPMPLSRI
jgi:hypothetical protein